MLFLLLFFSFFSPLDCFQKWKKQRQVTWQVTPFVRCGFSIGNFLSPNSLSLFLILPSLHHSFTILLHFAPKSLTVFRYIQCQNFGKPRTTKIVILCVKLKLQNAVCVFFKVYQDHKFNRIAPEPKWHTSKRVESSFFFNQIASHHCIDWNACT